MAEVQPRSISKGVHAIGGGGKGTKATVIDQIRHVCDVGATFARQTLSWPDNSAVNS